MKDGELKALNQITRLLRPLGERQQRRIVEYLDDRFAPRHNGLEFRPSPGPSGHVFKIDRRFKRNLKFRRDAK